MRFVLSHRHPPAACGIAYAAWRGFDSPLRHTSTVASCLTDPDDAGAEHLLLLTVDAASADAALAQLPPWVAQRTVARRVADVTIP